MLHFQDDPNKGGKKEINDFSASGMLTAIKDAVASNKDLLSGLLAVDEKVAQIAKGFGTSAESMLSLKRIFGEARDSIIDMGGSYDDMVKNQMAVSKGIGQNIILTKENQESLFATASVTGVKAEELAKTFRNVGIGLYDIATESLKTIKAAQDYGVNVQLVTDMVSKNMSYMNNYNFKDGVEGLSRMAAQAVAMRIDMKDIMQTAQSAFNPEGAIKMASELQRLGVTQSDLIDPMRLMALSENDPEELQKQIAEMSKQFVHLNEKGQFEILPGAKRQMAEIETSLKLPAGTLAKMAMSSGELEEKMNRIKLPGLSDEQAERLAMVSQLGKEQGEIKVNIGGELKDIKDIGINAGNFEEIMKQITGGAESTGNEEADREKMVELAKSQLGGQSRIETSVNKIQNSLAERAAGSKGGEALLRAATALQTIKFEKIGEGVQNASGPLIASLDSLAGTLNSRDPATLETNVTNAFATVIPQIGEAVKNSFSSLTTELTNLGNKLQTLSASLEKFKDSGITSSIETIKKALNISDGIVKVKDGTAVIKQGTTIIEPLQQDDIAIGTGLADIIEFLRKNPLKPEMFKNNDYLTDFMSKISTQPQTNNTTMTAGGTIKLEVNGTTKDEDLTEILTKVLNNPETIKQLLKQMSLIG